ncbi:MAG: FAD-dependent oxidoreductase [Methanothrix sp.]|nr:FAD-dependent oxidoreductase [Methanothrix sp.]
MSSRQVSNNENLQADVVVVGGGGTGLAAAVTAAGLGAKVILLEKRRAAGGNTALSQGLFGAETRFQKDMNIDATRDECFKQAMSYAHYRLNGKLVRVFIDKSAETIEWLEKKGMKFTRIFTVYPNQILRSQHIAEPFGTEVIRLLVKDCNDLGVQLLCDTPAKKILTDNSGKVTGLIAATGTKKFEITTRSVIIGTGGFGGNKRLLKKYCPFYNENLVPGGLPLMGDGFLMATGAGAATEGLGTLQLEGPYCPGSRTLWHVASEPGTIWVNKKGERFNDEAASLNHFEGVYSMLRQPDKISYTIIDEKIKQDFIQNGFWRTLGGRRVTQDELERGFKIQVEKGEAKISNSWDEIAEWIGANPKVLKATIDEYNLFCDQGYDAIFAKDRRFLRPLRTPPYYAIKCYPRYLSTIGGIKINHHMEVLDSQDNPIPGLYAGGNDTGGWEIDVYNAILSGTTVSFAITSGRISGENAAKYVPGK